MTSDASRLHALVRPEIRAIAAYKTPLDPLPIKLDANESPWPMPEPVRADLGRVAASLELQRYPDLEARALKRALAEFIGAEAKELVVGVGSDELIAVLLTAIARPRSVDAPVLVLPDPTFVMYAQTARVLGVEPVHVPLVGPDFALDLDATIATVQARRAALVFLASPNNPTGTVLRDADVRELAERCPETLVVVDEAYGPFRTRTHREALGGLRGAPPNVLYMGTLSKIGVAALRIGWLEAPEWLALELDKVRLPYNLPAPTQALGARILTAHRDVLREHVAAIVAERAVLRDVLERSTWLRPIPGEANFILAEARTSEGARALHAHLASEGIQVRAFKAAPLDRHLRITVGQPHETQALAAALERAPR